MDDYVGGCSAGLEYFSSDAGLNSAGSLTGRPTDLERVFTKDGLCSGCSTPLRVDVDDGKIKLAHCLNKACGKIFTNVVPTREGMKVIGEFIEFEDIL